MTFITDWKHLPQRQAPSEITLVCQAWRLGQSERGTDAAVCVFVSPVLHEFYIGARFGGLPSVNPWHSAAAEAVPVGPAA